MGMICGNTGNWQETECINCTCVDKAFMKPGQQAMAVAKALAEKWWKEGKLSYNWHPETDVEFLATVIQNNEVPNGKIEGSPLVGDPSRMDGSTS